MSQPISRCIQMKAIVDEEAYKELMGINKSNHIFGGHFTIFPCSHNPPCQEKYGITEELLEKYNQRTKKEWDIFMGEHDKEECEVCRKDINGYEGVQGIKE